MERTHRKDESVRELHLMAGQDFINFSNHTIAGMPGVIADIFQAHGFKPSDIFKDAGDGTWHEVDEIPIDYAPRFGVVLMSIFPKLEYFTVHRRRSGHDGGGSYAWKSFRPEWQSDKNVWRFYVTDHT